MANTTDRNKFNSPEETSNDADDAEDCPELDDDYFASIGQTFDVLDVWEESTNGTNLLPDKNIKKERGESSGTSKEKASSSRDKDISSKDPRRRIDSDRGDLRRDREKENDKNSSHRKRSPKHSSRSSTTERRRRSRSPPPVRNRRESPKRGASTFLQEMTERFPELGQQSIHAGSPNQHFYNAPPVRFNEPSTMFNNGMDPCFSQNIMQPGPSFMAQGPQFPPGGFPMQMDPYGYQIAPSFPTNMMNPMMTAPQQMMMPIPVPAPVETLPQNSRPLQDDIRSKKNVAAKPSIDANEAIKKAFQERKLSLTDYLKQVAHQNTVRSNKTESNMNRVKVLEKCEKAVQLMEELEMSKLRIPFVFHIREKIDRRHLAKDTDTKWKSPLVINDRNVLFLSQATSHNCADALLCNPLRNINGKLFNFARHLGLDLVELSRKVKERVNIVNELEKNKRAIEEAVMSATPQTTTKSIQTDMNICTKCQEREAVVYSDFKIQCRTDLIRQTDREIQCQPNGFNIHLDEITLQNMTRDQQLALRQFKLAFDIANGPEEITPAGRFAVTSCLSNDIRRGGADDLMGFTNPENPNLKSNSFLSFSPTRSQDSTSRSPRRKRLAERLGKKIPSPLQYGQLPSTSTMDIRPQFFRPSEIEYRIPTPPPLRRFDAFERNSFRNRKRSRSRSLSPPLRHRRSRSVSPTRRSLHSRSRSPEYEYAKRRGRY